MSVAIVGTDLTGGAVTETLTFPAGDNAEQTTANSYSAITSIICASDDVAFAGAVEVSGSISFSCADYVDLRELINAINALSGFSGSYTASQSYPATEIDEIASGSILALGNARDFRADLYAIVRARIICVDHRVACEWWDEERDTERGERVGDAPSLRWRISGTALTDWESVLETIEASDLQIIVSWSDNIDHMKKIKVHLPLSARAGRERNAWLGLRRTNQSRHSTRIMRVNERSKHRPRRAVDRHSLTSRCTREPRAEIPRAHARINAGGDEHR